MQSTSEPSVSGPEARFVSGEAPDLALDTPWQALARTVKFEKIPK